MNWIRKIKIKTVLLHLFFWVAVWFFFYYFFSYNSDDTAYVTWFSSALLPLTMMVTYFVIYYLIPKFLLTKKYFQFALYSFYTLIFLVLHYCINYLCLPCVSAIFQYCHYATNEQKFLFYPDSGFSGGW